MSSVELYNSIYSKNREALKGGDVYLDKELSYSKKDSRFGISLIIPVRSNREKYEKLVELMKLNEPDQYYYPFSDLHVTIFDYVRASEQYRKNPENEIIFNDLTRKAINGITGFVIDFKGIAFSREAGIIQGFDNNLLLNIRRTIRELMREYGITNDERYESESAHITFCRFRKRLRDPSKFIEIIDSCRDYEIGKEKIGNMELLEHDWYNKIASKRVIRTFRLLPGREYKIL